MSQLIELKQKIYDGYKIYGIKLKDIGNSFEVTVTCVNDDNNDLIRITSSEESFVSFVLFFRKYWNIGKTLIESHLNSHYLHKAKLIIAEQEFERIFLLHSIKSQPSNSEGTASFIIDINDHPNFSQVDFKDPITILDDENNTIFSGFVRKSQSQKNLCFVFGQDLSIKLREYKMNAEFLNGGPADIIAFIIHSGEIGLGINFHESIDYEENIRDFVVISPIYGVKTSQSFNVGEVSFYLPNLEDNPFQVDEDLISNSEHYIENSSIWAENVCRAAILVKAKHLYEAMSLGKKLISRAIDILSLRTDFTLQSFNIHDSIHNFDYDHEQKAIRVNMSNWIYTRDLNSENNTAALMDHKRIYDESIIFENNPKDSLNGIDELFKSIVTLDSLPKKEKNIASALHWLRRANQANDVSDKIIDMWNAAEFSVSNFKPNPIFSTDEHNKIKETINEIDYLSENQKLILQGKIERLNDPSLKQKFIAFASEINIDLSEYEIKMWGKARNMRNKIQHGSESAIIDELPLFKLSLIIEKMIMAQMNNISNIQ